MTMLHTMQAGWQPLRENIASDDSALDGVTSGLTFKFTDKPSWLEYKDVGPEGNAVVFYFTAQGAAATDTFSWKLYVYAENGPAEYVAHGTGTRGSAIAAASTYYVDSLTELGEDWYGEYGIFDSGNSRIAHMAIDMSGRKYPYMEITDLGGANECTQVTIYVSWF